jgi:hypothetical protein
VEPETYYTRADRFGAVDNDKINPLGLDELLQHDHAVDAGVPSLMSLLGLMPGGDLI